MTEQWIKWEPIPGLAKKYCFESVTDNLRGFKVKLFDSTDDSKKAIVTFKNSVDAYRSADESFRYQLICDLDRQYGSSFYGHWTFFEVINSSYVQWQKEQSAGFADSLPFRHFSLIAADSILDIIDPVEPTVELVQQVSRQKAAKL